MQDYCGIYQVDSNVIDDRTKNTLSSFTNFSHSAFSYSSDDYEVALIGIQFPMSFYNIVETQHVSLFSSNREMLTQPMALRPGNYQSLERLRDLIDDFFRFGNHINETAPKIRFNEVTHRVSCTTGSIGENDSVHFRFTEDLAHMLGFHERYFVFIDSSNQNIAMNDGIHSVKRQLEKKGMHPFVTLTDANVAIAADSAQSLNNLNEYDAETPFDLKGRVQHLFVYTDIIKHVPVGNSYAQLLRTFTLDRNKSFGQIDDRDFSVHNTFLFYTGILIG